MRLCSIASGSSGNCIYVGSDNTHLLVDVGISGKRVEQGLNSLELTGKDIDGILITHEHSDHIKGLGVIARKHQIPVYATEGTVEALSHMNLGKMPEGIFREIHEDEPFEINDLTVNPFTIPHDAAYCSASASARSAPRTPGGSSFLHAGGQQQIPPSIKTPPG